jgi:hypothetical protein
MTEADRIVSRREFLAASAVAIAGLGLARRAAAGTPSLKDVFKDIFLIGTALDFRTANEFASSLWQKSVVLVLRSQGRWTKPDRVLRRMSL